jgi:hypoxanthine phosphoribosyltransferase
MLLVDDIANSGKRLRLAMEQVQQKGTMEVQIATLYCKPFGVTKPDYHKRETRLWIIIFSRDMK